VPETVGAAFMIGFIVLLVGFLIGWIWLRYVEPVPIRVMLFYLALPAIFLFQPLFNSDVFQLPATGEVVCGMYPFKGSAPPCPDGDSILLADIPTQIYPWYMEARRQLLSGQVPLYNPAAACGMPLLENAQSSIFTLPLIISLVFPPLKALTVAAFLQLFFLLIFTHSYLLRIRLSHRAAIFGSLAFTFSSFSIAWLYFPLLRVLPYLPLLLYCIERLRSDPNRRIIVLTVFALAEVVVAGNPESAFIYVMFAVAYGIVRGWRHPAWKTYILHAGTACLWGAAISAFFWIPFLDYLPSCSRANLIGNESVYYASSHEVDLSELATYILPLYFGDAGTYSSEAPMNVNELAGYAGIFALFFAMFAIRRRPTRLMMFYAASLGMVCMILIRFPILRDILNVIPVLKDASPERYRILGTLSIAILGSMGLDRILEERRTILVPGLLFYLPIAALIGTAPSMVLSQGSHATLMPAVGIAIFLLYLLLQKVTRWGYSFLIICMVCDLLLPLWNHNVTRSNDFSIQSSPAVERLFDLSHSGGGRFLAEGNQFMTSTGSLFNLHDVRYNDPMTPWSYMLFVSRLNLVRSGYWPLWVVYKGSAIDFLSVKAILKVPEFPMVGKKADYKGIDGLVYDNPNALDLFFVPERIVTITADQELDALLPTLDLRKEAAVESLEPLPESNRADILSYKRHAPTHYELTVKSKDPFILASSITLLKPWEARDGESQLDRVRVNGNFLGFVVPAGERNLTIQYHHRTFTLGLWIGFLGILSMICAPFFAGVLRRKKDSNRMKEP